MCVAQDGNRTVMMQDGRADERCVAFARRITA